MSPYYEYARPMITVDTVVFDLYDEDHIPKVLLIKRKKEPFRGMWALPGGFLNLEEELAAGAARELYEETGIDIPPSDLEHAKTVGTIGRDPRGRVISVVFTVVIDRYECDLCAGDDAAEAKWFGMDELPGLAADHLEIIRDVLGESYHDRR